MFRPEKLIAQFDGDTYLAMTSDFFVPALHDIEGRLVSTEWCNLPIDLLCQTFDGYLISQNGDVR